MPLLRRHRLLLLLLFLLAAASHGDSSGDTYDASMCQLEPKLCGNVNISYPFYFAKDRKVLRGYADSYCGYPGLEILCEDDKPILQLNDGENYTVMGIDRERANVTLADHEVLDERCPRVDRNVTIPPASWLYFPSSMVDHIVFLLGCSPTWTFFQKPTMYQISCQSFDSGDPGESFVLPEDKVPPGNLSRQCRRVIEVPVLTYELMIRLVDPSEWRDDGYGKLLRLGFQLAWNASGRPAPCAQCERSSGRCGYNQARDFVGCLCTNGRLNSDSCSSTGDSKRRTIPYIIASTSSVLLLCLLFFAILLGRKKYRSKKISEETPRIESFLQKHGTLHPKRYTYAQVKRMTKSFAEKLGQGGFGAVYRGDLSDGRHIAVKMLKDSKADGEEFINEVASISKTSHVNVVALLGFCLEGSKRALIYDYMPNGSLERYAFNENSKGENTLGWEKLFDIAVGIARGLEYLHRGCNTRIVHFDIKPHNILLDQDFCPKISDFGLAKLCLNKESAISIGGARGTIGYIAPEVYSKQFGAVSSKSDVYSYGMMVLEMVGAREKNINANSESSSQYFPQWIYDHLDEYCVSASEINGEVTEIVRKMIMVGLWCIQLSPTNRPTMTRVVEMLEGSTSGLELPPKVLLS